MRTGLLVVLTMVAAGCGEDVSSRAVESDSASAADTSAVDTMAAVTDTATISVPSAAEDAVQVLRAYYAAIAARDYPRAYALWGNGGRASGQSLEQFSAGYAQTASVAVQVGTPGRIEGAAGSRYIEIPATVRALTTSGETQCFRGPYTLRRSEVPGATEEQRAWRIYRAKLNKRPVDECAAVQFGEPAADSAKQVVTEFGKQLASVSLLAPVNAVNRAMRDSYGPYVEPVLLEQWMARPADAPGRTVSSPWPDRIDILRTEAVAEGRYRIEGDVVYVTSTEAASGGAVERRRVTIEVTRQPDGRWLISRWQNNANPMEN